jgi:hypothetical protein
MTISRWIFLRMRNVSNKRCRENRNTHFMFSDSFPENRSVYEIMSTNMVEPERTQTIWDLRVAYWISKPTRSQAALVHPHTHAHTDSRTHTHAPSLERRTHTHTHTHTRNTYCFPRQQWFRKSALMLHYTYVAFLVCGVFWESQNMHV